MRYGCVCETRPARVASLRLAHTVPTPDPDPNLGVWGMKSPIGGRWNRGVRSSPIPPAVPFPERSEGASNRGARPTIAIAPKGDTPSGLPQDSDVGWA